MTIHKNGVVSANHGNDELYTTKEVSEQVASYYCEKLKKYDVILMPFNSKGSKLEEALLNKGLNVVAFDTDFFKEDFSQFNNPVIFDNPPFSKFGKVLKHVNELGFDYYLFGPSMSLFHHLRKEYVTGFNQIGSIKFDNADKKVNVGIYNNTSYLIHNAFNHTKKINKVKLLDNVRYSSGKIISRLENDQTFYSTDFSNYSNKEFGGSMIYKKGN